ncbi:MAG: alpha/beta hydrolase [Alphaproteobacteria bacterium]|nr:alpha/beta hydrolase [Alphaproteobacteria bacterium]
MAVFLDYDQEALDAQYNNRRRFPDYREHFARWRAWSDEAHATLPSHRGVPYGPSASERLDIFPAAGGRGRGAPVYVMIHGGYWYSLDKADYGFLATGLRPHGAMTVVPNYCLAPAHRLDEIVRQNRAMIAWLWHHAADYGGDPMRIYVCGHSAGGHLAMMQLATDWPRLDRAVPADVIKGVCSIAGIFELEPIRLSYLNQTLHLDAAEAARNSPLTQTYRTATPLMIVVGEHESEEYSRQNHAMAARWRALGYPLDWVALPGLNHFNLVNSLRDPAAPLLQRQLAVWAGGGA